MSLKLPSPTNNPLQVWRCCVCNVPIAAEHVEAQNKQGQRVVVYSPISRYWTPDTSGVLCGAPCALAWNESHVDKSKKK